MAWTDDQLDKLRIKMGAARRQGTWISAAEAALVSSLIWAMRRLTMARGWSGIPDGRLPTIGDSRRQGITKFTVHCATPPCESSRRFSFDELALDDAIPFVEIARHAPFRCRKCGGRKVTLMADWPSVLPGGGGASHSTTPFPDV